MLRKTGYSWLANKIPPAPETTEKPIKQKKEDKKEKEMKRLEMALERLMVKLGSDAAPSQAEKSSEKPIEEEVKQP